jgi:hypothetical protein
MISQRQADDLLRGIWQANRHLSPTLRARMIDEAILVAANSNRAPTSALFDAQIDAVRAAMSTEEVA